MPDESDENVIRATSEAKTDGSNILLNEIWNSPDKWASYEVPSKTNSNQNNDKVRDPSTPGIPLLELINGKNDNKPPRCGSEQPPDPSSRQALDEMIRKPLQLEKAHLSPEQTKMMDQLFAAMKSENLEALKALVKETNSADMEKVVNQMHEMLKDKGIQVSYNVYRNQNGSLTYQLDINKVGDENQTRLIIGGVQHPRLGWQAFCSAETRPASELGLHLMPPAREMDPATALHKIVTQKKALR